MNSDNHFYTILFLNDEQKEALAEYGRLAYDVNKISILLSIVDKNAFKQEFNNENSEIYKIYWKAYFESKYIIDKCLLDDAQAGKTEAVRRWDKADRERRLSQLKKELDGKI